MNVRALAYRPFLRKFLIIGIVCIAYALWALYDGVIGFPEKKLRPAEAYQELVDRGLSESEVAKQWLEVAETNHWPIAKPVSVVEAKASIQQQFLMMGVSLVIGIPMLIWYVRNLSSWVESTPTGLTSSWGQVVEFSQVTQLDKKKWYDKGIARLYYNDGKGQKQFVLDDFKFKREDMAKIMDWIHQNISAASVINDNPPAPKTTETTTDRGNEDNDDIEE